MIDVKKILHLILKKHKSIYSFCSTFGIGQSTISRLLEREIIDPSLKLVLQIAEALNVNINEIILINKNSNKVVYNIPIPLYKKQRPLKDSIDFSKLNKKGASLFVSITTRNGLESAATKWAQENKKCWLFTIRKEGIGHRIWRIK